MADYNYKGIIGAQQLAEVTGWWGKKARMSIEALAVTQPRQRMLLGVNGGYLSDWSPGLMADAAFESRPRDGGNPALLFTELPPPYYRAGKYHFRWTPGVKAVIKGPIATVESTTGYAVVEVKNPSDYGLSIAVDGWFSCHHEDDSISHLTTSSFRQAIKPFKVVRWMPAQRTNYQSNPPFAEDENTWAERGGVPMDTIAHISRETDTRPWICIPWNWTQERIEDEAYAFAGLKPYVEWSNEVLFSPFSGNGHRELVHQIGAGKHHAEAYALHAGPLLKAFKDVCPGVTTVLSAQHYNPDMARIALEAGADYFDMVAPAAYGGPHPGYENGQTLYPMTVAGLIESYRHHWLDQGVGLDGVKRHRDLANSFGKKLGVYECGHHIEPIRWPEPVRRLVYEALDTSDMRMIYRDHLKDLDAIGCEVACHYQLWSPKRPARPQQGCWGLLDTYCQDPNTSQRYLGCVDYAKEPGL